jgi:hypothetical protein
MIILIGGLVIAFDYANQSGQANEYNYSRVASGMNIIQVTEIVGEGEIHYLDKRMVVMKYIGEGVEIRVIFVNGLVYQKSLELEGRVMNQDGNFLLPETEL